MSEIFTLSKKLITIKLENISHHPVYENLIPFYHKLNDYLKIYSEKFIHTYIKLNPPCVVKLNDNKNNFYIEDNNFSKKNLEELFFKNLCQQYSYLPSNFMRHYFRYSFIIYNQFQKTPVF